MRSINVLFLRLLVPVLTGAFIAGHVLDYRINLTSSVDGLVWKINTGARPVRGDLALVCLPQDFVARHRLHEHVIHAMAGTCGGIVPLLKRVVGIPGDRIAINESGITINHVLLPHTAQVITPAVAVDCRYTLSDNKYILAGDTENSLDSRYFGEIDASWIMGTARNVL